MKKIRELYTSLSKPYKILVWIVGVWLVGLTGYLVYASTPAAPAAATDKPAKTPTVSTASVKLTASEAVLEYGDSINSIASQVTDAKDLAMITFDENAVTLDDDLQVPAVGKYENVGVYDNGSLLGTITLFVNDTTPPEFKNFRESVQIDAGYGFDAESLFEADDISEVEVSADLSKADINTPGKYEAYINAEDAYGNKTSKAFTLYVLEPSGMIQLSPEDGVTTVVDDIILVNKKHMLSSDYNPGVDYDAQMALKDLLSAMSDAGLDISMNASGFRTYESQSDIYNEYVAEHGVDQADTYSTRPGASEHQTGLAFDLMHEDGSLLNKNKEVNWLKSHAADYGFIIRYPEGKESETGFRAKPYHIRYIGSKAKEIAKSGKTLEEYLEEDGGGYDKD